MDHGSLVLSGEFKYCEKKKKVGKVTPEANKLKINTEHLKKKNRVESISQTNRGMERESDSSL